MVEVTVVKTQRGFRVSWQVEPWGSFSLTTPWEPTEKELLKLVKDETTNRANKALVSNRTYF